MAPLALDSSNSADWVQVYTVNLSALPISGIPGQYHRLPAHSIPTVFDRHILAIEASLTQAQPTWDLAFYVTMLVSIPGIGRAETVSIPVTLGLNVIDFPVLSSQFTLKAKLPKWHTEMRIAIWKYTGI